MPFLCVVTAKYLYVFRKPVMWEPRTYFYHISLAESQNMILFCFIHNAVQGDITNAVHFMCISRFSVNFLWDLLFYFQKPSNT